MPINKWVLSFDLDNTLWETDPVIMAAEQECYEWMQTHSPASCELYSLGALHEYRMQLAECYPDLRHQLTRLRYETLRRVFMQGGHNHEEAIALAQAAFDVFHAARNRVTLFDGVLPVLTKLAERFPIFALTNGNADLKMVGIDHLFSQHFHAEGSGAAKPAANMFKDALTCASITADRMIHIGDHPLQDVAAAKRLGLKSIWMNLSNQDWQTSIGKYKEHDWAHTLIPDATVASWNDLTAAINNIVGE